MTDLSITYPTPERATITLQRPGSLNSLDASTLRSLAEAAAEVSSRDLKVVVVAGAGRAFSAGADFELLEGKDRGQPIDPSVGGELGQKMADAIESIPAVTIARLQGAVVGGGLVLAAACDLRVAAEDTYFSIPEVDIGLPLGWGGVPRLVREIGPALAKELIMTCRPFTADEAKNAGFINTVVPLSGVDQAVEDLADALCSKSRYALLTVKRTVAESTEEMLPALDRTGDAALLAGAFSDPESIAAAESYIGYRSR